MTRLRLFIAFAVPFFLTDVTLFACPICFRVEENATTDGVLAAVVVLVSVTTVVLGTCGVFVFRFARRDRRSAQGLDTPEEP